MISFFLQSSSTGIPNYVGYLVLLLLVGGVVLVIRIVVRRTKNPEKQDGGKF
jgi:hypothetical protein